MSNSVEFLPKTSSNGFNLPSGPPTKPFDLLVYDRAKQVECYMEAVELANSEFLFPVPVTLIPSVESKEDK